MRGVDALFFSAVIRWLGKKYPQRACGDRFNEMVELLGRVEEIYQSMPEIKKGPQPCSPKP